MTDISSAAPATARKEGQFQLKEAPDLLSPKNLLELPRPGVGIVNPGKGDLILIPVSQHCFEAQQTNQTVYIAPLASTVSVEFPIITGGEVFWLDSRTVAHVVRENIYAVSLEYQAPPSKGSGASFVLRTPAPPYLIGSFPAGSSPTNFKVAQSKTVKPASDNEVQQLLVFSAKVYKDYDLTSVKEQDDFREDRDSSAMVYDGLYVRHWDEYVSDKKSRLFSVELNKTGENWTLGEEYFKPLEGTDHFTPVEISGGPEDFDVSGTNIVYTTKDPSVDEASHTRQNVYIVPLKGGVPPSQLTTGHQGATHSPVFSPDGTKVAWAERALDGYIDDRAKVMMYDLEKHRRYCVTAHWDRSAQEIAFADGGNSIFLTASEHGHVKIFQLKKPECEDGFEAFGKERAHVVPFAATSQHSANGIQPLPGNKLVFSLSSFIEPSNVYFAESSSKAREGSTTGAYKAENPEVKITKVTKFAEKGLQGVSLDAGTSFWFEGAHGKKVQGWSFRPRGYDALQVKEKKWPAVLAIHDGPQSAWEDGWNTRWNLNVFAQQGYWVIAINPTGSTGFGQDFVDAITEDWGGKPFMDLKKGWEYALNLYPIDKHRSVAAGASWGGFAINWIQGHPEYDFGFKALFCHAGIFDTRYGGYSMDEPFFWNHDFGGVPWRKHAREIADKSNPSEFVHKWSTPQLIVHGGKDYRVPETEGLSAFNALQQRGVPSRLMLFPDENHWVLEPANSLKWHYEVFRWFDEWARVHH